MPKYEAIIPVRNDGIVTPVGELVELSHDDAEIFLRRGFVKKPEKSSSKSSANKENSEG